MDGLAPEYVAWEIIRPEVDAIRMILCGEVISQMWNNRDVFEALERMAGKFADAFAQENPGFNRFEWDRACGFEDWQEGRDRDGAPDSRGPVGLRLHGVHHG